jgi:hypothetical protein
MLGAQVQNTQARPRKIGKTPEKKKIPEKKLSKCKFELLIIDA